MRRNADNAVVVVSLEPDDFPARIVFQPRPEIDLPRDVAIPVHKYGEMLQVKVEQLQKRLAVANHKPPAKSPIDIVHDAFHSLALFPASGIRDESWFPFARAQEFHVVACSLFSLEYVR